MSTGELLLELDALGLAAAGWIATWFAHSAILCLVALGLARWVRSSVLRGTLFKAALVGALFTASAPSAGIGVADMLRVELQPQRGVAAEIGIPGLASRSTVDRSGPRQPAPVAAPEPPAARWRWAHLLPLAALACAALGARSLLRGRRRLHRALAGRQAVERAEWTADLDQLSRHGGRSRAPRLSASATLDSPIALARDEIVVPARALDELAPDARRALLAHELAHLVRRDPQWLLATALVERLLALQPLQRVVRAQLVDAIELACDEQAVRWLGDGLPLARCLSTVAGWVAPRPAPVFAASMVARESALVRRVERALNPAAPASTARRRACAAGAGTLLLALACGGPRVEPDAEEVDASAASGAIERTTEPQATLDFASDGTIHSGGALLYDPTDEDFGPLEAHLAQLVADTGTEPSVAADPDSFPLATCELVLHATGGAPTRSLQKAMEHCAQAGIWRLRFTGDWPGGAEGFAAPLPIDIADLRPPIEEPEEPVSSMTAAEGRARADARRLEMEASGHWIDVTVRVRNPGAKVEPQSGQPWSGSGPFEFDDTRRVQYSIGPHKVERVEDLRERLERYREEWPDARIVIDARPGTVYRDVVDLMETARAAGFDEFTFVGARD